MPLNAAAGVTFDVKRSVRVPCASAKQPRQLWCVVNERVSRGSFWSWAHTNIGHAAEYLFKCWSFIRHEQSLRHEGQDETRLLVDYIQRGQPLRQASPRELMAAMGLTIVGPRQQPTACAVLWAVPSRQLWPGWGEAWFASPPDAWRLTAACIGRQPLSDAATQLSLDSRPSLLRNSAEKQPLPLVGVLLRGPSQSGESSRRDWPHAAQLAGLLGEASGVRGGHLFWLNDMSLAAQAHRVRELYDIIITTHGPHSVSLVPGPHVWAARGRALLLPAAMAAQWRRTSSTRCGMWAPMRIVPTIAREMRAVVRYRRSAWQRRCRHSPLRTAAA